MKLNKKYDFDRIKFIDFNGNNCDIGVGERWENIKNRDDLLLSIGVSGIIDYPISKNTNIRASMTLDKQQIEELIQILQKYVDKGSII